MERIKIIALMVALMTAAPLWGGSIDVGVGKRGTIVIDKKPAPLRGNMIDVTTLGIGSDALNIVMGRMTFVTGPETGHSGHDYTFGAGGSLTVTGCVDLGSDKDKGCDKGDFRGVLLTAKFLKAAIVEEHGKYFLQAEVLEQINPELAALLNLTKTTYVAKLDLSLMQAGQNGWLIRDWVLSGSLFTIAEPSSLVLLLVTLLSLAGSYRFWAGKFH